MPSDSSAERTGQQTGGTDQSPIHTGSYIYGWTAGCTVLLGVYVLARAGGFQPFWVPLVPVVALGAFLSLKVRSKATEDYCSVNTDTEQEGSE